MLTVNPTELIWTVLCFLLLYVLLRRFLFTPLTRFMDERSARIRAGHDEEQAALAQQQRQQDALDQYRQARLKDAAARIGEEHALDEQRAALSLEQAKQAAKASRGQAADEAQALRAAASAALSAQKDELADCLIRHLLDEGNS